MVSGVFNIPLPLADLASKRPAGAVRFGGLDRFIVGPENGLLDVVSKNALLGQVLGNPLFLYGPSGSGKTHLALGLAALWQQRGKKWSSVEAGQFHRLTEIEDDSLLIIENIDRLSATAERKLCLAIDQSIELRRQLVITSKSLPAGLVRLSPGLRSRLGCGLVIGISKPSRPVCLEILGACAVAVDVAFTPDALELLADSLEPNPGSLIRAVKEIAGSSRKTTADSSFVKSYLASSSAAARPPLSRFAAIVARRYRVTVAQLKGRSRRRGIATARSIFMYLAHELGHYSFLGIGKYLDGRDHTTILHGCRSIQQRLLHDIVLQQEIIQLKEKLPGVNNLSVNVERVTAADSRISPGEPC